MFSFPFRKSVLAGGLLLVLAACDSPEEQAEAYLNSAKALIESGDTDRAVVELRNVFEFVPNHVEARLLLARMMLDAEQFPAAYGQYLRLIEQVPDNYEGRIALAELAFNARNWEEFNRHGEAAVGLEPDQDRSKAVDLGLRYRAAVQEKDAPLGEAVLGESEALAEIVPDNAILRQIRLDGYVRAGQYSRALTQLDALIEEFPEERLYYNQRLGLLNEIGDTERLETGLRDMIDRFADDLEIKSQYVQFLISQNKMDTAEAFLREISDPAAEDTGPFLDLIRFVAETRGVEAAKEEIARAVEVNPNPNQFRAIGATMDFAEGDQEGALAVMEDILSTAEPSESTNEIKVLLANMLISRDNDVGAQRLVDEVLNDDVNQVDALKMKAAWQIEADEINSAIANLRLALDNAPEDVPAMNLMSQAYTRLGSHDLARDFMALAVEASNNAAVPSLRYAALLVNEESYLAAEDTLLNALRRTPNNLDIVNALGQLYLRMEDFDRVRQAVATLRQSGSEQALNMANNLEVAVLNRREGTEKALQFIEEIASSASATIQARMSLIGVRLRAGEGEKALELANSLVAENPERVEPKVVLGAVQTSLGNLDDAEQIYREVVETTPDLPSVWINLSRVIIRQGRTNEASELLDEALAAVPGNLLIQWTQASLLESEQKFEEAIEIYETLYKDYSNSLIVSNNLASLLTTHNATPERFERAWEIARRLKDTDVPAFQDTYGWLVFNRGDAEEAEPYLLNAATELRDDPIAQYHLAELYRQTDRADEAMAQYRKVVEVAGPLDRRPQIEQAREILATGNLPETPAAPATEDQ